MTRASTGPLIEISGKPETNRRQRGPVDRGFNGAADRDQRKVGYKGLSALSQELLLLQRGR